MSKTIKEKLMDNIAKALTEAIPELLAEEKAKTKRYLLVFNYGGFKRKMVVNEEAFERAMHVDTKIPVPFELVAKCFGEDEEIGFNDIATITFCADRFLGKNVLQLKPRHI